MSRKGGEICQVDLFIKPSPARCTLECSSPQCMPKHDRPPSQVLSTVCFSFQLLVVWRISHYLLFVWVWWQSNKVPFGKWSDTCWEMPTWSSRFCPAAMLTRTLPPSSLPVCIGFGGYKESRQKISQFSASKIHWSQRDIFGEGKVLRLLRQKFNHTYALFLQDLIQRFDDLSRLWSQDRKQPKHSPGNCLLQVRDLPSFLEQDFNSFSYMMAANTLLKYCGIGKVCFVAAT